MFEPGKRLDLPPRPSDSSTDPDGPVPYVRERKRHWFPDVFLLALVPIVAALTAIRLDERIAFGPSWDTYAFLDNAADMAGRTVGYVEPHRPPLLSFLTSLVLRAGYWNVATIQVLDALLTVVGVLAFYFLLRRRFERPLAMAASVLLVLVPPLWTWLGSGYTDFPSVALSILGMFLLLKATEDDPRWYWAALPVILLAILTRFGAFLMIAPAVLWLALRAKPFQHAKQIGTGLGLTLLAYVPAGIYYNRYFSDPFFPFGFVGRVAEVGLAGPQKVVKTGLSLLPGWFYLRDFARLLLRGPEGLGGRIFLALTLLGLVVTIVVALARQRPRWRWMLPLGAVALVLLTEWKGGSIARVGSITVLGFIIASFMRPAETTPETVSAGPDGWRTYARLDPGAALALDATVLVWGLLFFDAHGHMQPQIDRYFITMAPAALYFVALAWRTLGMPFTVLAGLGREGFAVHFKPYSRLASIIGAVGLAVVCVVGVSGVLAHYSPTTRKARDPIVMGAEKSALWLAANDPDIKSKTVYSDVWPLTSWYLGTEAHAMPTFESAKAYPHELEKNRVDYFITIRSHRYPGYAPVFNAASATVLKYQSTFPRALPAIAYIGDGWDAYVEQLCNFDFNLYFSSRRQLGTGTWMLDRMTPEDLAQYDAVAVFGAHWRNKGAAEKILRAYVRNGGVAIIDASRNMDGFSYPLVDTVFMDVLTRRRKTPASAEVSTTPELAAASQLPTSFPTSPFVDENGGPWYGASCVPAVWARASGQEPETFQVIASVGTEPMILLQCIGKGRIYWVSNNLVWHSYLEGNQNEVRLVRGLFRTALNLPPIPDAEVSYSAKPWFVSRKLRPLQAASRLRSTIPATQSAEATAVTIAPTAAKRPQPGN